MEKKYSVFEQNSLNAMGVQIQNSSSCLTMVGFAVKSINAQWILKI